MVKEAQGPVLSENTRLLDCSTHPRALVMTRTGVSVYVRSCVGQSQDRASERILSKTSFQYLHKGGKKNECRVLFKIIKGAVLPLCPVWTLDVETRKMKGKIVVVFFFDPQKVLPCQ